MSYAAPVVRARCTRYARGALRAVAQQRAASTRTNNSNNPLVKAGCSSSLEGRDMMGPAGTSFGERALRGRHCAAASRVDADGAGKGGAVRACRRKREVECVASGARILAQLEVARGSHLERKRVEDVVKHLGRERRAAPVESSQWGSPFSCSTGASEWQGDREAHTASHAKGASSSLTSTLGKALPSLSSPTPLLAATAPTYSSSSGKSDSKYGRLERSRTARTRAPPCAPSAQPIRARPALSPSASCKHWPASGVGVPHPLSQWRPAL